MLFGIVVIKNLISSVRGTAEAPKPVYLQIEPTSRCNLNCKMCFRNEAPYELNGDMPFELFREIADKYKPKHVVLTGFGEPFLHKDIFKMVDYLKGVFVEITSNGVLLNEDMCRKIMNSNISQINISIDGVETYEKIRGVKFEMVYNALLNLVKMRKAIGTKKPIIVVNTVIIEDNLSDLANVVDKLKDLDIVLNLKTIRPNRNCKTVRDDELVEKLVERAKGHKVKLKYSMYKLTPFCYRIYFGAYINYKGDMFPCCDLFKPMGHALKDGGGWNSDAFKKFRASFKNGMPKECTICNLTFNQRVHRFAKWIRR